MLARIVAAGWRVMGLGYTGDRTGEYDRAALAAAVADYDGAQASAGALRIGAPLSASPYLDVYRWDDTYPQGQPGLGASVDQYRNRTSAEGRPGAT